MRHATHLLMAQRAARGFMFVACCFLVVADLTAAQPDCIDYSTLPPYPLLGTVEIFNQLSADFAVVGSHAYVSTLLPVTHPNHLLSVVDISDASNPQVVGSIGGSRYPVSTVAGGGHVYVITEDQQLARYIQVYDVDPPFAPAPVNAVPSTGRDLALAGHLLYVAAEPGRLEIVDISNPSLPILIGVLTNTMANDLIVVSGSYAYLASEHSPGRLVVVDVSQPTAPAIAGTYVHDTGDGFDALAVHGDLAVVRSGPPTELLAIDVSDPSAPALAGRLSAPGAGDLAFDDTGILYSFGSRLGVYDVSDPTAPVFIGSTDPPFQFGRIMAANAVVFLLYTEWQEFRVNLDLVPVQCPLTAGVAPPPAVAALSLDQARPNPFRGSTMIHYELATPSQVELSIFDVQGRMVRRLLDGGFEPKGKRRVLWDGVDQRGRAVSPGVYFVKIGGDQSVSMRLTLLE